jgi:hypothetical protein
MHWSDGYLAVPHQVEDCAELVQRILREQFGRHVEFPKKQSLDVDHRSELITRYCADFARPITQPYDGCGMLMFARGRKAHMGLYCGIQMGYVLHSHVLFGESIREPINRINRLFRLEGFYAWLD